MLILPRVRMGLLKDGAFPLVICSKSFGGFVLLELVSCCFVDMIFQLSFLPFKASRIDNAHLLNTSILGSYTL